MKAVAVSVSMLGSASAFAVVLPGGPNGLDPLLIPKYVTPLVIPPEMPKSPKSTTVTDPATGAVTTVPGSAYNVGPEADYNIAERQFGQQILPARGCAAGRPAIGFKSPICNVIGTGAAAVRSFKPTTVWGYGRADDAAPAVAPVPAATSSFNYPSFTMETANGAPVNVRWINELVSLTNGRPSATSIFLPSLTPVDQSMHWANPGKLPCLHPTATGTDCEPDPARNPNLGLPYTGPVPMSVHVHGAEVNPQSDGYAEAWWLPAAANIPAGYGTQGALYNQADAANAYPGSAFFHYENEQAPTTIWYHDHTLGMTRNNVYAGPAGYWMVRGNHPTNTALKDLTKELPGGVAVPATIGGVATNILSRPTFPGNTYAAVNAAGTPVTATGCDPNFTAACRDAIREIPIVLQDRSFNADGTLFFPTSRDFFQPGPAAGVTIPYKPTANSDIAPIWNPEFFGNTTVVNGNTWPNMKVFRQRYRFRFLDGSDARSYNLYAVTLPNSLTAAQQNAMSNADVLRHLRAKDAGYAEVPFYQIGAEQGFLPKVVKITMGVSVQLPGNGTNVNGACVVNTKPNDPLCERGLLLMPAERADVIMDFTALPARTQVRILNTGPDLPFGGMAAGIGALAADPNSTGAVMTFTVAAVPAGAPADASTSPLSLVLPAEAASYTGSTTGPTIAAGNGVNITRPVGTNPRKMALLEGSSDYMCMELDLAGLVASTWTPAVALPFTDPNVCIDATHPAGVPYAPRQTQLGNVDAAGVPSFQAWMDPITAAPKVGETEDWEMYNTTVDAHPMHMHLVRFQVLNREVMTTNLLPNGNIASVVPCTVQPDPLVPCVVTAPEPSELGYKDTVMAQPGEITRVRATFIKPGLYVWHCHVVDHEDNEMMHPMYVKDAATPAGATVPAYPQSPITGQTATLSNGGAGL